MQPYLITQSFLRRYVQPFLLCLFCLALPAGCGSLISPGQAPVRMQISPEFSQVAQGTKSSKAEQLIIAFPQASDIFASDSITLIFNQREMRRLLGYRWASTVPAIMQQNLVTGMSASKAFAVVADDSMGISSRFRIVSTIKQFSLRYERTPEEEATLPPTAVIDASFTLVDATTGNALASLPIIVEKPAAGIRGVDFSNAFEQGLVDVVNTLTPWAVEAITQAKSHR